MTALQLTIAALQSILQLWAAAAYGAAFFRTRLNAYRTLVVGQLILLGSILAMLRFDMTWLAALLTAATLWATFSMLANRSNPIAYPGYPDSRTLYLFGQPLAAGERRGEGLFVPHAGQAFAPEQKRILALSLVALIAVAIFSALLD